MEPVMRKPKSRSPLRLWLRKRYYRLRRRVFDQTGGQVGDEYICENHVMMMYEPLLPAGKGPGEE